MAYMEVGELGMLVAGESARPKLVPRWTELRGLRPRESRPVLRAIPGERFLPEGESGGEVLASVR
jgi:hypothetical protein